MWPWGHLAFGYLLYAAVGRTMDWRQPDDVTVAALAVGTQLPDLVDKPLAWGLGWLPSGLSLGHSLVFAVTVTAAVTAVAIRAGHIEYGGALGIGIGSHLVGDGLFAVAVGSARTYEFLLWPFVAAVPDRPGGLMSGVSTAWTEFLAFLATPVGRAFAAADLAMLALAVGLWVHDGAPGTGWLRRRRVRG